MSDQKIKAANDKVPLDLIPSSALKGVARVFGYGARKYAMGNYLTADDPEIARRYIGGVLRHLGACQLPNGMYTMESIAKRDDESGLPEIDHAITGLLMLRALAVKHGAIPADPGLGNDPREAALLAARVAAGAFDVAPAQLAFDLSDAAPAKREPKFGDRVRVLRSQNAYYDGREGRLTRHHDAPGHGLYEVQFAPEYFAWVYAVEVIA